MDRKYQTLTPKPSQSSVSPLYRPPSNLLFEGSFQDAKAISYRQDLWLLVHLQSKTEVPSLNQELWSNKAVSKAITFKFILWQVDDSSNEGRKISSLHKIDSVPPAVLLIDPITGQKIRTWNDEIEAEIFLDDLKKYIDASPHEQIASLARNISVKPEKICFDHDLAIFSDDDFDDFDESADEKTLLSYSCGQGFDEIMSLSEHEEETCLSSDLFEFPVLTEEPKGDCDRSVVCSICVRFPNGRSKQRKFLKSEPIQLLWSFCYSHMEESERKAFKLVQAVPGALKTLDYGAHTTFDQSGIANSIVSVTWE